MAILKDLIVNGASRFIGDAYFNTIKAGVWNGTAIDVAHGGTGLTTFSSAGLVYASGTTAFTTKQLFDTNINSTTYDNYIPTGKALRLAISAGFAANDAMQFAGTYSGGTSNGTTANGTFTTTSGITVGKGCTWRVSSAGYFGNQKTEVGDLIIAIADSPGTTAGNYVVIQKNMNIEDYVTIADNQTISGIKTFTNNVILKSNDGATPSLIFLRNSLLGNDAVVDWRIYCNDGYIYFDANRDTYSEWTNKVKFNYNGDVTTIGKVSSTSLLLQNGTNSNYTTINAKTSSGAITLTLPNSTGTIALTTDLSSYLPLTGGTLTGTLILNSISSNNWTEGIRINSASNGWATLTMGGTATSGTSSDIWSLHAYQGNFYLANNGSSSFNNGIQCVGGAWTIKGTSLKFGGNTVYHSGNLTKVSQLTNDSGYVTSSGVTSIATSTGLTGGTITSTGTISIDSTYQTYISHGESAYNSLSNYVLKKPNIHFYNYIGCSSYNSTWYKITLPFHATTYTTNRWMMVSMELILKGNYQNCADGTIYLSYYIYYAANDNVGEANKVYGMAIGSNMHDVRVAYLKTDLGILYVYVPNNYNSFAIQNLSANDSAANYNFSTTTIEPLSSSNYPADSTIQDVNIRKLYTIDGTSLLLNGKTLIDSGNIGSQSVNYATSAGKATNDSDGNAINSTYLKKSGGTMTGLLTTTSGNNHNGIKVGNTYINAINGNLILLNNDAIRFGSDSWDYNAWAGLKYVHSSKIIYLGLADGSIFTANSSLSEGKIYFPGISDLYTGNGTNKVFHAGNYTSWINTTNYPGLNKVGTVTSVGIIAGTGISVSNSPITSSGNITVTNSGVSFMVTPGDNRSVATTPNDYSNKIIFLGLKNKSTIGSPSNDTYSYLVGLRGWSDSSGGKSHEFAFNDTGIYRRVGSTTSWESWIRIADSDNSSLSTSSNVVSLKLLESTASVYNTTYIDNLSLYANKSTTTSSIALVPTEWKQLCQLSATTLLSNNYGTYVVQITKGTGSSFVFIGSGIMSYGSTNSSALEEIVLHCYGGDDNRLYLGTQNGYLMGAAKVSLSAAQYTITFKRII